MAERATSPNFMNGVPELLILRLLAHEEMYGHEIVQAIRSRTDAAVAAGEGMVYPVLHGLESEGALKSRRKVVNGRSRVYYSVTRTGSCRLADLSETWTNLAGPSTRCWREGNMAKPFNDLRERLLRAEARAEVFARVVRSSGRPDCGGSERLPRRDGREVGVGSAGRDG